MGGTSWFPSQRQSQHWAVSLSQAQNVQTTRGCHRAGIFRAFTSSLNPGLFPWQLSGELIKFKKKNKKNPQEQFEHTDSTFVTYQLTKLAALRFLVIKIDHVPATEASLCHSYREKSDSNNQRGEITGFPRPQPYIKPSLTPFKTLFQYLAVQML